MEPGFSPALMDEVTRAAALEGVSDSHFITRAIRAYAVQTLARHNAIPLLKPEPWREFRAGAAGSGSFVSFRVKVPFDLFARLAMLEDGVNQESDGTCKEDVCAMAESRLWTSLNQLKCPPEVHDRCIRKLIELAALHEQFESMDD